MTEGNTNDSQMIRDSDQEGKVTENEDVHYKKQLRYLKKHFHGMILNIK